MYNRMFKCDTPVNALNCVSLLLTTHKLVKGTVLCDIISVGFSSIEVDRAGQVCYGSFL